VILLYIFLMNIIFFFGQSSEKELPEWHSSTKIPLYVYIQCSGHGSIWHTTAKQPFNTAIWLKTKVLVEKVPNVSRLAAWPSCHLLTSFKGGGIIFHSTISLSLSLYIYIYIAGKVRSQVFHTSGTKQCLSSSMSKYWWKYLLVSSNRSCIISRHRQTDWWFDKPTFIFGKYD
jgi:hypothetical protein